LQLEKRRRHSIIIIFINQYMHQKFIRKQTLEKSVFRQWTFCLSSTKA
jgi:hypothetical protein